MVVVVAVVEMSVAMVAASGGDDKVGIGGSGSDGSDSGCGGGISGGGIGGGDDSDIDGSDGGGSGSSKKYNCQMWEMCVFLKLSILFWKWV